MHIHFVRIERAPLIRRSFYLCYSKFNRLKLRFIRYSENNPYSMLILIQIA